MHKNANEIEIINLYKDRYTLRHIADIFNTDHHMVKRILVKNGIEITRRNTLKEFSDEHKHKISESRKKLKANGWIPYNLGLKMSPNDVLKNMGGHLKYDVTLEWLSKFEDIEKLKYLNRSLSRKRDYEGFTTEIYIQFIEKFYIDNKFNELYLKWVNTKDKWIKPSLDHIIPKAKKGTLLIDNLQFIGWLENRAKIDIDQDAWNKMKENINYYL